MFELRRSLVVFVTIVSSCNADIDMDLLRQIAATNRANFQNIATISGAYECEEEFHRPVIVSESGNSETDSIECRIVRGVTLRFSFDSVRNTSFFALDEDYDARAVFDLDGKAISLPARFKKAPLGVSRRTIVAYGNHYELLPESLVGPLSEFPNDPYHGLDDSGSLLVTKRKLRSRDGILDGDVRGYFVAFDGFVWQELQSLIKSLDGGFGKDEKDYVTSNLRMKSASSVVTLFLTLRPPSRSLSIKPRRTYAFDITTLLPIEAVSYWHGDVISGYRSWSWTKVGDTHVPEKHSLMNRKLDGSLAFSRTSSIDSIRVNEPIDEETFTVAALGIADGDRIVDTTANRLFVFSNGATTPASDVSTRMLPLRDVPIVRPEVSVVFPGLVAAAVLATLLFWRLRK